jgi:tagaturonate reductase
VFLLWVIEGDDKLLAKIPFNKINENVLVVNDMQPYRTRKVRILNGAHTAVVPFSMMYGNKTVKETMDDTFTESFLQKAVYDEINRTLPLSQEEVDDFAEEVFDRFRNPFIKHLLSSIVLNSVAKFKVRVLPSLVTYKAQFGSLPTNLTFSLACLIRFYKGDWQGETLPVQDDAQIVAFFDTIWKTNNYKEISEKTLSNIAFWDEDISQVSGLVDAVANALELIDSLGIEKGLKEFSEKVLV